MEELIVKAALNPHIRVGWNTWKDGKEYMITNIDEGKSLVTLKRITGLMPETSSIKPIDQ